YNDEEQNSREDWRRQGQGDFVAPRIPALDFFVGKTELRHGGGPAGFMDKSPRSADGHVVQAVEAAFRASANFPARVRLWPLRRIRSRTWCVSISCGPPIRYRSRRRVSRSSLLFDLVKRYRI